MPTYIKYKDFWSEIENHPKKGLIASNYYGGWFDIDENSEWYMHTEVCQADDWHHLHRLKGFDPTERELRGNDLWVSPFGTTHDGEAHAVAAEDIAYIWYNWNEDDCHDSAEYVLEQHRWIKLSKFFWDMHLDGYGYYGWSMTQEQADVVKEWCELHGIEYPEDIIDIRILY